MTENIPRRRPRRQVAAKSRAREMWESLLAILGAIVTILSENRNELVVVLSLMMIFYITLNDIALVYGFWKGWW